MEGWIHTELGQFRDNRAGTELRDNAADECESSEDHNTPPHLQMERHPLRQPLKHKQQTEFDTPQAPPEEILHRPEAPQHFLGVVFHIRVHLCVCQVASRNCDRYSTALAIDEVDVLQDREVNPRYDNLANQRHPAEAIFSPREAARCIPAESSSAGHKDYTDAHGNNERIFVDILANSRVVV